MAPLVCKVILTNKYLNISQIFPFTTVDFQNPILFTWSVFFQFLDQPHLQAQVSHMKLRYLVSKYLLR